MAEERKTITSMNLALVLAHDQLLAGGIQAGDGPLKQAIMRHKTRLHSELQKIKIKRGIASNIDLAQSGDCRTGLSRLSSDDLNRTDLRDQLKYLVMFVSIHSLGP